MKTNLALLHAFEVSIAHKKMKHKNGKWDADDVNDITQVFYPLIDILKHTAHEYNAHEAVKAWVDIVENSGKDIDFPSCPCTTHVWEAQ